MTVYRWYKQSKPAQNFVRAASYLGAATTAAGAGIVFYSGLSGAFNTVSAGLSAMEPIGLAFTTAAAVAGGIAGARAVLKGMDRGMLGKLDAISGPLVILVGCPVMGAVSAALSTAAAARLALLGS